MTGIKKGDRVRVVIEGEVSATSDTYTSIEDSEGYWLGEVKHRRVVVEKIEPPIEVFKPGDVVRSVGKLPVGNIYALTEDGFVRLAGRGWAAERNGVHVKFPVSEFTSEFYERVTLE